MSTPVGSRLGPYEIVAPLGAGGMGEVYRARDTRLGRDVALKVLPEEFGRDPERLRRFEREARSASALSDPHIVTVFDVGEEKGTHYFASELVEGSDLRRVLDGGVLPLKKALDLAGQIASGLAAAHEKGIVHRDLKPENILITKSGTAKIADFGLAKLSEASAVGLSQLPTTDGRETTAGVILGTVAYMSPEQARGEPVDHRSDIFSFGTLLYEMLSGRRPFQRSTAAETMAAILKEEAFEPSTTGGNLSPALAHVVVHCLEKDPAQRFQSVRDVAFALREAESRPAGSSPPIAARRSRISGRIAVALAGALAGAGAAGWLGHTRRAASSSAALLTFSRLTADSGLTTEPALSSDGKLLAYASDRSGEKNLDIYVRQVGGGAPIRLTRDPADDHEPAFSPDGTVVAFRSERQGGGIYVVSTLGGPARLVAPQGKRPRFSPDGRWIAYWVGSTNAASISIRDRCRIYIVPSAGGQARRIRPDFAAAAYPAWTPDGRHLVFLGNRDERLNPVESIDWWVTPIDSGPVVRTGALGMTRKARLAGPLPVYPWVLLPGAWQTGGDSLLFSASSGDTTDLWKIAVSPKTWAVTSPPERLTSGTTIEQDPAVASGPDGAVRLAFANLSRNLSIGSVPIDPKQGKAAGPLSRLTRESADDFFPALSPDGGRMAWISSRSGNQEVWVENLKTGEESALTATQPLKWLPLFSPDGTRVSFSEVPTWDVYVMPSAGGAAEIVCQGCGEATAWTPDGEHLIGNTVDGAAWILNLASRRRVPLLDTQDWIVPRAFSPDGRWFSFGDGTLERAYIAPFRGESPAANRSWIELGESGGAAWSPDGKLLYGVSSRDGYPCLWAQRVDPNTRRPTGAPFAVLHLHDVRFSLLQFNYPRMAVGRDKALLTMSERTGNIWMAEWKPR